MALADIVKRIGGDAAEEAESVLAEAHERAESLISKARAEAESARVGMLERARKDAESEAQTVLATARLAARDKALAAKRALVERALDEAKARIRGLPDGEYSAFLAQAIARAAQGGEAVFVAGSDRTRLRDLAEQVDARAGRDLSLRWSDVAAPEGHDVVLVGDRVTVDLSVATAIAERRDELAMIASSVLFGGTSSTGAAPRAREEAGR